MKRVSWKEAVPALVCAVLSVVLIRGGLSSFFFLVPLGFMASGYESRVAWGTLLLAVVGNGLFLLGTIVFGGAVFAPWIDLLYFTVTALVFIWISALPFKNIAALYRFILGSAFCSVMFLFIMGRNGGFEVFFRPQAEMLDALYAASAGTDVVERSLREQTLTPEAITRLIRMISLRGGALVSCMLLFFVNRQVSLLFARLICKIRIGNDLIGFHTGSALIWVLSCSLLLILVGTITGWSPVEIGAWNLVTVCAVLYLVQGGGIVLHLLTALPPLLRLSINVLIVVLLFSPGINVFTLGGVILLGIAENWVPFRAPKPNGPSSTPEM